MTFCRSLYGMVGNMDTNPTTFFSYSFLDTLMMIRLCLFGAGRTGPVDSRPTRFTLALIRSRFITFYAAA
jgi:hypothetical protein